jgi:phenylacetate-coenzyme A ligase PaaK-like adenylate-forming protein
MVTATSEPLMPDVRAALGETWGAPVMNWWGTSEGGPNGVSCGFADGMHLAEDMQIIEFVDDEYRPVSPGQVASRILHTNLINPLMPLIRYEITDEVRVLTEPCPCGSAFARVADIEGRTDDCFVYNGGIVVHPHVYRSPLARDAGVLEYQVRQTTSGADIDVRCSDEAGLAELQREVAEHLEGVGLRSPVVHVRRVDAIARTSAGKLARVVPLR